MAGTVRPIPRCWKGLIAERQVGAVERRAGVIVARGRLNVFWDIEPESDPQIARDPAAIRDHVLRRLKPGSIVLLRVMYASGEPSRRALPAILATLKARGYPFVTVRSSCRHEERAER